VIAAEGLGDAQRRGGPHGVLEEQLVEVAHPEEHQGVGLPRLGREILRHHRRGAGRVEGCCGGIGAAFTGLC
jgi:hypothetical protein